MGDDVSDSRYPADAPVPRQCVAIPSPTMHNDITAADLPLLGFRANAPPITRTITLRSWSPATWIGRPCRMLLWLCTLSGMCGAGGGARRVFQLPDDPRASVAGANFRQGHFCRVAAATRRRAVSGGDCAAWLWRDRKRRADLGGSIERLGLCGTNSEQFLGPPSKHGVRSPISRWSPISTGQAMS